MGFVIAVSWSAQNAKSHWWHVHTVACRGGRRPRASKEWNYKHL